MTSFMFYVCDNFFSMLIDTETWNENYQRARPFDKFHLFPLSNFVVWGRGIVGGAIDDFAYLCKDIGDSGFDELLERAPDYAEYARYMYSDYYDGMNRSGYYETEFYYAGYSVKNQKMLAARITPETDFEQKITEPVFAFGHDIAGLKEMLENYDIFPDGSPLSLKMAMGMQDYYTCRGRDYTGELYLGDDDKVQFIYIQSDGKQYVIPAGDIKECRQLANKLRTDGVPDSSKSGKSESQANQCDKVGRNQPCPCGSGKKHKKCCGA